MWLFRHVNVMSYKCSVMSTELAPFDWLVGSLVGWFVGWSRKGCPCCLFGSWFVSLFPFLKTLKTGSQVREYAWLLVASGLVGLVLREVIEEQLKSHWLQLFSSFFSKEHKLERVCGAGCTQIDGDRPVETHYGWSFRKICTNSMWIHTFQLCIGICLCICSNSIFIQKLRIFICNWEFRPLVLLKDQARLLLCQLFFPRLAEIIILLLLLLS